MKTSEKHFCRKALSMLLAVLLIVGVFPTVISANGADYVYISVSDDGVFTTDNNGDALAYTKVSLDDIAAVDLDEYNLGDYKYDKDGDGNHEITALHLYIYVHEQLLCLSWDDVNISGGAGSIYFSGGLFGFSDENLRYNYNGAYPANENGWGLTADQIVLSDGDFIEVAHYSDWSFWMDSAAGFHYFTDVNDKINISYSVEAGTALPIKLVLVGGGMGGGDTYTAKTEYTVSYGSSIGNAAGTVTTDDNGEASITFSTAGTYYIWCDGDYGNEYPRAIVSAPAGAMVTVTGNTGVEPDDPTPDTSRESQDVSDILDATMEKLAATVTEPTFGTNAGEWTVLSLARGEYYAKNSAYFSEYYNRIVEIVNETAASVNMNGALHKNKSTENSRLIVALSAIGKDATSIGNYNLVEAYSLNGFDWIKKQGLNGTIWALIALDSGNYATSDDTIRQQCVDAILAARHDDGGWSLSANASYASDPDMTGMALTALYPYRDQEAVATACEEAIACLSDMQHDNGIFASGGSECSESCAWVIVALTTWGINPDTDSRFIKNGNSVVDGLLAHYLEDVAQFQHVVGGGANGMATDQSCYALVAYDRFVNGKTALFDCSDVTFDEPEHVVIPGEPAVLLGLPTNVSATKGTQFSGVLSIDQWNNDGGYKLIDFIISVPAGVSVTDVTVGAKVNGGEVSYHFEEETGKLRVVYFDANEGTPITLDTPTILTELFTIGFEVGDIADGTSTVNIAITGMSLKTSSDSTDSDSQKIVNTDKANANVTVTKGMSVSAMTLYAGDDVDLIPSGKKAIVVSVTNVADFKTLTYNDGETTIEFRLSMEITDKSGVATYVAMVDADFDMKNLANGKNYKITDAKASEILFGDINGDGIWDAQDALAVVNAWLRKSEAPADEDILTMNVNGDSRINTYDALAIVEKFIDGYEWAVVSKAASNLGEQN